MSFKRIPGQEAAAAYLLAALQKGRLPHALLFEGPEGCGQLETALELAKTLFCERGGRSASAQALDPCGECQDCRLVESRAHPDFFFLAPEEDSRVVKIEAIRRLIQRSNLKPFRAASKVFVIDHADGMNDVAQNALLKTLEEPAGDAHFILITSSPEALLETVRSRAQAVRFASGPAHAQVAEETRRLRSQILEFAMGTGGAWAAPDLSKLERGTLAGILDFLIGSCRDALLVKIEGGEPAGEEELLRRIELLSEAKEKILANLNIRLTMAFLWEGWFAGVSK